MGKFYEFTPVAGGTVLINIDHIVFVEPQWPQPPEGQAITTIQTTQGKVAVTETLEAIESRLWGKANG
jgi:hypothetical protein